MEKVGERNEVGVTFLPPDYTVLILTIGPEPLYQNRTSIIRSPSPNDLANIMIPSSLLLAILK